MSAHLAAPQEYLAEMLRLDSGFPRPDDAAKEAKKWVLADRRRAIEADAVHALSAVIHWYESENATVDEMEAAFEQARAALARLRGEVPA